MTKIKKTKTTRKTKTTKTSTRSKRTRNAAHTNAAELIGATWTDVLLGALPILASFLTVTDDDDDSGEHTDRVPLCSVCGRLLELPGVDPDRAPAERITPFPAYRDLGALFTKAAA